MKDRIKEYIEYKGITAGELAISLDVQRSNISHILNGRNKPGAALIEKMLVVFPDLNARWLLTGDGSMINSVSEETSSIDVKNTPGKKVEKVLTDSNEVSIANKPIDKVVLLYKDGTFSSYSNK